MIYFIQADGGGPVKIGYAIDPQKRLAELQRMSPATLQILATIEGDRKKEGALHRHFSELRQHGEWFKAEAELLNFIANPLQELPARKRLTLRQAKGFKRLQQPGQLEQSGQRIRFRLKELMAEHRVTFKDVSQGAGVSTNTLYMLRENKNKHFGIASIARLLKFFDCQPNDLIIRTKE